MVVAEPAAEQKSYGAAIPPPARTFRPDVEGLGAVGVVLVLPLVAAGRAGWDQSLGHNLLL